MIYLGIDPGSRRIGFGIIEKTGTRLEVLDAGILKIESSNDPEALMETKREISNLLQKWRPSKIGIEKLYFSKNQRTAIQVAQARGVLISEAVSSGLQVLEFSPNEVKLNITGYGSADKKAVAKMVRLILSRPDLKLIDDAMDALALAIVTSAQLDNRQTSNILPSR